MPDSEANQQLTTDYTPDEARTVEDRRPEAAGPTEDRVGRFLLRERLGEGAFGIVYRAHDPQLDREVALKVGKPAQFATAARAERFLREARAAANLRHPHIVPLYETGQDGSQAYLASAFIPGRSLERCLREKRPTLREAVILTRKLAEALAYAHGQGIVHRDVKPANVLVDEAGEPHLLDFGLAGRTDEAERLTQEGTILGTPLYMAPEAAEGRTKAVGPASDQYSLGCSLYQLLTGRTPFEGAMQQVMSDHIRTEPPSPRMFRPDLPPDLETIVLKTLAKEPQRRYASCQDLADDLRRWLDGEPIRARRLSPAERLTRWVGRNPAIAMLTGAVVLSLAIGAGIAGYFAYRANEEAAKERTTSATLKETLEQRNQALEQVQKESAARAVANQRIDGLYRTATYAESLERIGQALKSHNRTQALWETSRLPPDLRGWEADHREWQVYRQNRQLVGHRETVLSLAFSPDGKRLASAGGNPGLNRGELMLWDVATGNPLHRMELAGRVRGVAFSLDGQTLASVGGTELCLWNAATGERFHNLAAHAQAATCVAFHPDGKRLVTGGQDRGVHLWDATTGERLASFAGFPAVVLSVAVSPDGTLVAAGGGNTKGPGQLRVWETETRRLVLNPAMPVQEQMIRGVAFSPREDSLACTSAHETVLLHPRSGRVVRRIPAAKDHENLSLCFRPDGLRMFVGTDWHSVRIVETGSGEDLGQYGNRGREVYAVACSPDGQTLAVTGRDPVVSLWDAGVAVSAWNLPGFSNAGGLAFSPDGSRLIVTRSETPLVAGRIQYLEADTRKPHWSASFSMMHNARPWPVHRPDGAAIACPVSRNLVREWNAADGRELRTLQPDGKFVTMVRYRPDGELLAVGDTDGTVRCFGREGTTERFRITLGGEHSTRVLAFSPDGKTLAVAGLLGAITLHDAHTGEQQGRIPTRWLWTEQLEFSPDGRMLVAAVNGPGTLPPTLQVWDWPSREERFRLETGTDNPALAFTPDCTRLVFGGKRGPRVVDLRAGRELLALGTMDLHSLAFSPDGSTLVGIGPAGILWGWDPRLPEQCRVVHGLHERGRGVTLSADGTFLLGIAGVDTQHSEEAEWRGWDYPSGRVRFARSGKGQDAIQAAIRPDGRTFALALKRAVTVHDAATGQETARLDLEKGYTIQGIAWQPDGSRLAIADSHRGLHLWEPGELPPKFFPGHNAGLTAVAWNPDGTRLATTSEDGTIKLWDAQSGRVLASAVMGRAGQSVVFTPDGKQIIAGGRSRELRVWSADLTQEVATVPTINFITHLAIDPQGRQVAGGGGHVDLSPELCLWDTQTWKLVHRFPGQHHPVRAVAFTPDGRSVLSMAEDRKIVVWAVPGGGCR